MILVNGAVVNMLNTWIALHKQYQKTNLPTAVETSATDIQTWIKVTLILTNPKPRATEITLLLW